MPNDRTKTIVGAAIILGCFALIGFLVHEKAETSAVAATSIVGILVAWWTQSNNRKDPPNGAVVIAAVAFASILACGCASPQQAGQNTAETAYTGELLRCVDSAKTLAESRACRARVDAAWGITQTTTDGGAK